MQTIFHNRKSRDYDFQARSMHRLPCGAARIFYRNFYDLKTQSNCPHDDLGLVAVFVIGEVDGLDCFPCPTFHAGGDIGDFFTAEQSDICTERAISVIAEERGLVGRAVGAGKKTGIEGDIGRACNDRIYKGRKVGGKKLVVGVKLHHHIMRSAFDAFANGVALAAVVFISDYTDGGNFGLECIGDFRRAVSAAMHHEDFGFRHGGCGGAYAFLDVFLFVEAGNDDGDLRVRFQKPGCLERKP